MMKRIPTEVGMVFYEAVWLYMSREEVKHDERILA